VLVVARKKKKEGRRFREDCFEGEEKGEERASPLCPRKGEKKEKSGRSRVPAVLRRKKKGEKGVASPKRFSGGRGKGKKKDACCPDLLI